MASIIPILLGQFALGAVGGFAGKKAEMKTESERLQRESLFGAAKEQAILGNTEFFNTPEIQKAFKRFGIEESIAGLAAISQAPLTQQQRDVLMENLRAEKATAQAKGAGATTEKAKQEAIGGIIKGAMGGGGGKPQPGDEPISELQKFEGASPEVQALISAPAAQAKIATTIPREEISARKEISASQIQASAAEKAAELKQRSAELEEKKRTGVSAQEQISLRREETAIAADRNKILREDLALNRQKLDQADRELGGKIATSIFGEGIPAKASKEISDFFTGKAKTISADTAKLAGVNTKTLTNALNVAKEGNDLRKQALKMIDDIIAGTRGPKKTRVSLSTEEIQTRINQANETLRQAYTLLGNTGFFSQAEIQQGFQRDVKVLSESGILSPEIAAGLGLETSTSIPGLGVGPGTTGLSPAAQKVLDRFLKPDKEP